MEAWELNEKKKEYLNGYKYAKRRERRILEQIQQLRLDAMFPCLQGDGMPRGGSQSDLSDYMEKYEDLMEELKEEKLTALEEMQEIRRQIGKLKDEDEKEVLERRYILIESWDTIAEKMGIDKSTATRKHGKALKNFEIPESCISMHIESMI